MFDFEYQLKILPDKPGVYFMKNSLGEVIYVGKAKVLKNRVRQYFQSNKNHGEKVKAMVKHIAEFEYIVTDSEVEALILECNLIKKYSPRYNILLKDDKYYPFIKITIKEEFPRVFITRNFVNDGAKYLGPYTDGKAVYDIMELIKKIFPLRTCKKNIKETNKPDRPCLNYHIGKCLSPCGKHISREEYGKKIKEIMDLLNGKNKSIVEELKKEMSIASENLNFEEAAQLRDKILAIEKISERQRIVSDNFNNEDFIDFYKDEKDTCVQIFFQRDGKITGREHFTLENTADIEDGEVLTEFIKGFYGGTAFIPKNIYVSVLNDEEIIAQWLSLKAGYKVNIKVPQIGEKRKVLEMVKNNAKITLEQFKEKIALDKAIQDKALQELRDAAGLEEIPKRIESYDISNIMGMDSVGSMVVFENGKPKNSDYRRFKINTVQGANDYDSMREILQRRFTHGLDEIRKLQENEMNIDATKFSMFPDLILMDGGKGQVNIALEVLNELNIRIPVCGMVKDDKHRTRGLICDNIEVPLKNNSQAMHLITRIQDEVHRFAITYHRSLRDKRTLLSVLEGIPNIGEKRRRELLKKFGSVDNIKKASLEELMDTPSMTEKSSISLIEYFKGNVEYNKI
ncbi:Excinuclease ABC subunit C [Clostridium collagenovorans DSM 3089]|uniref:UvrABC system protein C n=1 Tax=Clostridium collagenovorans DSM 3089 TaxID=1121306 RepID=A0A1M5WZB7_9CLOT|nr:excinuclease ABC subunit UvrC [Clostridium collagenovorans]SHH92514.1 Excinuclease ABC subunit C [Clostridium collagenovorans DSM 3089]